MTIVRDAVESPPRHATAPRLGVFTTHPIQYQVPFFRELARRGVIVPVVLFGSSHGVEATLDKGFGTTFKWDIPLLEGYESTFVANVARRQDVDRFTGILTRDADRLLREQRLDALLIMGWQAIAHLQMLRAARRLRIPVFMRGDSNLLRRPSGLRGVIRSLTWLPVRRVLYRAMFSGVDDFFVVGSRNAAFYRRFGVPEHKLHWAPHFVDNPRFALPSHVRSAARARLREQLGVGEDVTVFVAAAKVISRKRPLDLLDAFSAVAAEGKDVALVYVGDGRERPALEGAIAERGLAARVRITGFVNQRAIPEWYAAGDCLVLPSDYLETWGLAVNEAMAAGLPAIVSDAIGCAPDLVEDGATGFQFPFGDVAALADRMRRVIAAGPDGRAEMGERARQRVAGFSLERVANEVERVTLHRVQERSPASSQVFQSQR